MSEHPIVSGNPLLRATVAIAFVAMLVLGCSKPPKPHPGCAAREIPPFEKTQVSRPDVNEATFSIRGNNPEQRDFFFLHEDGSYDYVERWDLGVPGEEDLQLKIGWDWKVGCRMHMCPMPDGTVCCYQRCTDGGDSGMGYEAPDQFDCMNKTDGGRYDWFIEGLQRNAKPQLAACLEQPEP